MSQEATSLKTPDERTQFAVLLFTDICDSTALKAEHGAMAYKRAAELHNTLFEELAAEENLTLIKNTGDGYFARTASVAAAVRFALRFQNGMRGMAWIAFPLTTRVGIHAGEVADITTLGQADVVAPAADLVARVMGLAVGGQVLLTRSPFDEARHFVREHPDVGAGLSLAWLAHGPYLFKGCTEPVEVFEVGATVCAPLIAPPDGEKAKRALRPGDEETLGWRPADGLEIPGRPGWRIAGKLGAGGFGEVWAGVRDKTHERRAYKFCFDAERLRALKREVTLTRLLRETLGERNDIVRIFDLRLDEPPYFLESELATDGNLLQWAEKMGGLANIPLPERIELVAATATALAAAHSVGVLHKDIKPTNVLIFTGKDGHARPRLVDFGIGTLADSSVLAQHGITGGGFTQASLMHSSGTPTYSPPEYLAGKAFTVQGDVYSLGVMLYQLVTAQPDAPLAEGWQRDVPDELLREDIALCVDGDPTRRLPSAADLATRLLHLDSRRETLTTQRQAAATEQARRKRQRQLRFTVAAAVLIAAITIPLALWALREKENAEKATGRAITNEMLAISEKEKATAQVREASRSDTATAQQCLAEGKWQEAVAYLGRAIRYDSENHAAQDALWLALLYGERDAGRLPVHVFAHERTVNAASFSLDGSRVVTASDDSTAQVWDTKTGMPVGLPLKHDGSVNDARFSPDSTRIVTASYDHTARLWNAESGMQIGSPFRHEESVNSANFSPDGNSVVTASFDKSARVWSLEDGLQVGSLLKHEYSVNSAIFSPNGTHVLTSSSDGTARIWDALTGIQIGLPLIHDQMLPSAVFSPDGTSVVTSGGAGQTVRIWNATAGMQIGSPIKHQGIIVDAVFSPDGTRIATASEDKTARIWDGKTGLQIGPPMKHGDRVRDVHFSPDGTRVVTASGDKTTRVWDAKTGLQIGSPFKHENSVETANFNSAGTCIISASKDNTARIWDAKIDKQTGASLLHDVVVRLASFSHDGATIVSISDDAIPKNAMGNTARIWEVNTTRQIGSPLKHKLSVVSVKFRPNGTEVVTESYDGATRVWDVSSGAQIGVTTNEAGGIPSAIASPAPISAIKEFESRDARVWDVRINGEFAPRDPEGYMKSARASSDQTRIVTSVDDHTARVWDSKTRSQVGPPLLHKEFVGCAEFSPDGSRIVTASDHTARVWDARSVQPLSSELAESLTAFLAGARLDPQLGSLQIVSNEERLSIWKKLEPALADLPDWRFVAQRAFPSDPKTALVSPRMSMTIREATTLLIGTLNPATIQEAAELDPGHPLLPFAHALREAEKTDTQPANPIRAAWLIAYGMKRLPADTTAPDLRLAAQLIAAAAKTLPEQKPTALTLLDRAAKLAPEDDETKALRETLK